MTESLTARIAVLRRYYDAFNRHDVEAMVSFFHPEADFIPMPSSLAPPGTRYHGRAGVRSLYHGVFARGGNVRIEPREFQQVGEHVMSHLLLHWGDGRPPIAVTALYLVRNEQICRVEGFETGAEALASAGARSEPGLFAEPRLTARQREVFRLLAQGLTGPEVAERLVLSPYTVRRHVEKGVARLDAKNRVQAVAIALSRGEIEL